MGHHPISLYFFLSFFGVSAFPQQLVYGRGARHGRWTDQGEPRGGRGVHGVVIKLYRANIGNENFLGDAKLVARNGARRAAAPRMKGRRRQNLHLRTCDWCLLEIKAASSCLTRSMWTLWRERHEEKRWVGTSPLSGCGDVRLPSYAVALLILSALCVIQNNNNNKNCNNMIAMYIFTGALIACHATALGNVAGRWSDLCPRTFVLDGDGNLCDER